METQVLWAEQEIACPVANEKTLSYLPLSQYWLRR